MASGLTSLSSYAILVSQKSVDYENIYFIATVFTVFNAINLFLFKEELLEKSSESQK
jgi:hypothetical protein